MVDKKRTSKKKVNAKTVVMEPLPQMRSKKVQSNPQISASTGTVSPLIGATTGPMTSEMVKANLGTQLPQIGANLGTNGRTIVGANPQRYMPGPTVKTTNNPQIKAEGIGQINDLIESNLNAKPIQEMMSPNNAYTPDLGEFKVPMKNGKFTTSGEAVARKMRKQRVGGKK